MRRTITVAAQPDGPRPERTHRDDFPRPAHHRLMSLRAMLWALHDAPVDDPTATLVLLGLADHASDNGTAAWPSRNLLARYARCSTDTVDRRLRNLVADAVVLHGDQRLVAHVRANRRPTVYDLNLSLRRAEVIEAEPAGEPQEDPFQGPQPAAPGAPGAAGQPSRGRRPAVQGPQLCGTEPSLNRPEPGGETNVGVSPIVTLPNTPPLPRCPTHHGTVFDGPCGPCGDARRTFETWRLSHPDATHHASPRASTYVPTPECIEHPGEPAGRCTRCAHVGVRSPGLRSLLTPSAHTPT